MIKSREHGGFLWFCGGKYLTGGQSEPADNEVSVGEPPALTDNTYRFSSPPGFLTFGATRYLIVTAKPAVLTVVCKSGKNIYIYTCNSKKPVLFSLGIILLNLRLMYLG